MASHRSAPDLSAFHCHVDAVWSRAQTQHRGWIVQNRRCERLIEGALGEILLGVRDLPIGWLPFELQVSIKSRKCDDVLRAVRRAFRRNSILERRHRQISRGDYDDRCMLANAGVAVGEPSRCEAQVEGSVLGDQGHHLDLTECLGVEVDRRATWISFDAKPSTKSRRASARLDRLALSVDRQMSISPVAWPLSWRRTALPPMITTRRRDRQEPGRSRPRDRR